MLSDGSKAGNGYLYHYTYAYILGPLCGGLLAGIFHNIAAKMHEPEDDRERRNFDSSQKEKMLNQ